MANKIVNINGDEILDSRGIRRFASTFISKVGTGSRLGASRHSNALHELDVAIGRPAEAGRAASSQILELLKKVRDETRNSNLQYAFWRL